jgi:hypothetical protein
MTPDDLTRPLQKRPAKQPRHGMLLPIIAGTLSGVLSGLAILFAADAERGKAVVPAPPPQAALADSVRQPAPVAPPLPAMQRPKTITLPVVDSQTGAKREVIVPAPTNDQSDGDVALGSTTPINAADKSTALARARRGPKSQRR